MHKEVKKIKININCLINLWKRKKKKEYKKVFIRINKFKRQERKGKECSLIAGRSPVKHFEPTLFNIHLISSDLRELIR